ncbi:hypothetical protein RIR_jg13560.t3 [Rhizophagus irregularis DAOM 181602=DAOM 197198]|nr:hypothetical protein RIR_jg13560.t3 [Rhizophagus irregularis DAOM 181602=DAOM 197198]
MSEPESTILTREQTAYGLFLAKVSTLAMLEITTIRGSDNLETSYKRRHMDCGNKIINVRDALTNGNNERPTAHRSRVLIRIRVRSGYGLDRSGRKWEFRKIIMNDQGSKTSNDLINATKKYRRANDQDDPRELKRSYISEIKDKEFKSFFLTKIMSL